MKTNIFYSKITSSKLQENLEKQFGSRVNLEKYGREQLEDFRNKLRTRIFQQEGSAGVNDLLTNETYQKDKAMLELLNTRIKEMLGEQMKQLRDKMDALNEAKKGVRDIKHAKKAKGSKPDFLDLDKDGNKAEPMKSAAKSAKVKEGAKKANKDYDGDGKIESPKDEVWGSRAKAAAKSGKPFKEGFPTVDYDKVLNAIAALYGDDMWDNDAMQDLANDLEQAGPTDRELDFIIARGKLPKRLAGMQFSAGDDVQFKEGFPTVDDAKKNAQGTAGMKTGDSKKSSTGGTITKTATGLKHTAGKNYGGQDAPKTPDSDAKSKKVKEEMKVGDKKKSSTGGTIEKTKTGVKHTAGKNYGAQKQPFDKNSKDLDEGSMHPKDCDCKECMGMYERDEGKHNNKTTGFKALAKKAGGGEKGAKIAGAQRQKMKKAGQLEESQFKHNVRFVNESLHFLLSEDEEGKAKAITAAGDIVNDYTSWMQRVGQYQTKSMIELADAIRADFGAAEAEAFKNAVGPALSATLEVLTQQRETVSNAVAALAGEAVPETPMGQEPGMEPGLDAAGPDEMNPDMGGDEFGASDAAAGGAETAGREMRESREARRARKLAESHSIISKLAK